MKKNIVITFCMFQLCSCSRDPQQPGVEYLPDMVHSEAFEAYSESAVTKNGASMLFAPKGSIPRGYKPFSYGNSVAEAERAGRELINPQQITPQNIERGKVLYANACLVCHGETGKGDGPLIPKFPNPPSFTSKNLSQYPAGRLYYAVTQGVGDMPSHAAQLNEEDRWNVVLYVQELQKIKQEGSAR